MAKLVLNAPPIATTTPTLVVDAGSLPAGTYQFTLVVQDKATGVQSAPKSIIVKITPLVTPTPVIPTPIIPRPIPKIG